jgi:RNA polymerase sigma-70 factor (ECF subfamily)
MRSPRRSEFIRLALSVLPELYNAAVRLTRNEYDADDLVQDTYVQAFEHADQLRDLSACRTWLFRIMRNEFLMLHRAGKSRPELLLVEGGLDQAEPAVQAALQFERSTIANVSHDTIAQALGRLPAELRTAVTMCDIEGFAYQEIAEIMGCSVGTVRSRIARARKHLMKALATEAAALGLGKGRKP